MPVWVFIVMAGRFHCVFGKGLKPLLCTETDLFPPRQILFCTTIAGPELLKSCVHIKLNASGV